MPYRTQETLERWLDEFRASGREVPGYVAPQDGTDGSDTGLILLRLTFALTDTYVQPVGPEASRWEVTFEERSHPAALNAAQVSALARELDAIAELCAFLEAKSVEAHGS